MRRPFENRGLIATQNMLRLNSASSQYVDILLDSKWIFTGDFTISFLVFAENSCYPLTVDSAGDAEIYFRVLSSTTFTVFIQNDAGAGLTLSGTTPDVSASICRITLCRSGSALSLYCNDRLIDSDTLSGSFTLFTATENIRLGATPGIAPGGFLNGYLGNLIVLNGIALTRNQLQHLHETNILPPSLHSHVIAHYPLNQDHGDVAYDVSEQYNYSRTTPYDVEGFNGTTSPWTYFENGALPTISYGSDVDGNYVEIEIDDGGLSSYFYPVATQESRISGAFYLLTFKIKRVAGTGNLNLQQFGNTESINYDDTQLPIDTLITIVKPYNATSGAGNYPIILLSGVSAGGAVGDIYRVYEVKNTPFFNPVHVDLINFTNDEIGVTNELLQSAWHNLYGRRKIGDYFLKPMNDVYGIPSGYAAQTFTNWTMLIDFIAPISTPGIRVLFGNQTIDDVPNITLIFLDSGVMSLYLGEANPGTISYTPGERYRLILEGNNGLGVTNYMLISSTGSSGGTRNFVPHDFEMFSMGKHPQGTAYFNGAYGRYSLFNRLLTARELEILKDPIALSGRLALSGLQFDIDFGNVFESGGSYFATDYSGNNRHAELFNFVPATDQPVLIEQSTGLPSIRKALKLNGTNQYLSVSGFTPTKEKGYTIIVQAKSLATNFSGSDHLLYHSDGSKTKYMYGINGGKVFRAAQAVPSYQYDIDAKKIDSINTLHLVELGTSHRFGINGQVISESIGNDTLGFDEIVGNLIIGGYTTGSFGWDGYLSLVAIWKGVLKPHEIMNIVNNSLGQNPSPELMTDCQLYLNFNEIKRNILTDATTGINASMFTLSLSGDSSFSVTEGSDGDGNYVQFELLSWTSGLLDWVFGAAETSGNRYDLTIVIKLVGTTKMYIRTASDGGALDMNLDSSIDGNSLLTKSQTYRHALDFNGKSRIGFNSGAFSPVVGSIFRVYSFLKAESPKIPDHSTQNRNVYMRNYSDNEIDSGHVDYRLVDLDTLR